jgi:transcription antitermination protein NusB
VVADGGDAPFFGPRHQARERALSLLYEAEMKGRPGPEILDALPVAADPYAERLVRGVAEQAARIDELLASASRGWEIERMPAVDRALLRMAVYELLEEPEVPLAVVIDEAVTLAGQYSTDDSGRFVNGVLSALAARLRPSDSP